MRELGDRGQSEREVGGSFTEAGMSIALKDIKFFSKCSERKTSFYEEGRVCGREVSVKGFRGLFGENVKITQDQGRNEEERGKE